MGRNARPEFDAACGAHRDKLRAARERELKGAGVDFHSLV